MRETNLASLKFTGILLIVFAAIYAIVGTLALMGTINAVLPGHEKQEILVVILAYAVALLALICGIACVKGSIGLAKILGLVFAVIGIVSLIYIQITQDTFSIVDCIASCYGISIFSIASKIEKGELE